MNETFVRTIRVRVPASISEVGPVLSGFGLALSLENHFTFQLLEGAGLEIRCDGPFSSALSCSSDNLAYQAFRKAYEDISQKTIGRTNVICTANVPVNCGLGSSATAILAGLYAGSTMGGRTYGQDEMLFHAAQWDGGYGDVVPSLLGGFTLNSPPDKLFVQLPSFDEMNILLIVPEIQLDSRDMQSLRPENVTLKPAATNMARSALLAISLIYKDPEMFSKAFVDELLQPRKRRYIPGLSDIMLMLNSSKIDGLAVTGPSLLIFHRNRAQAQTVYRKVNRIFSRLNINSQHYFLNHSPTGLVEE